jgi:pilus assembly protein Flp/PilA
MRLILNSRGQSLVEYLLLVALMAVATIGIVKVLNRTVQTQFANVTNALQGENKIQHEKVVDSDYRKKDMSDFMSGASNRGRGSSGGSEAGNEK